MNKNVSYDKVLCEEIKFLKKDQILIQEQNHSYLKKFCVKLDKKRNIFLHTIIKISRNLDIKHLRWNKTDLSKETKKILRRDTLRISVAVIGRFKVKKVSFIFKNSPPVYLHIIKIDIK